jgi:hypothetical protein
MQLVPMAERSEARTVFARSNAGIMGSNPTQGSVSAFFCVVLPCVGTGLVSGRSPIQGVLPTVQIDS